MSSTIIIKNSATSGSIPSSLVQGEFGINVTNGRLFYGSGSGNVVKEFGVTSSYALQALSASYASTASYALNIKVSGAITDVDYIDFDTNVPFTNAEGRLGWDVGENSLQLGLAGGNVQYSLGEQIFQYCFNAETSSLTKGQVVFISGSQGNQIAVKLANNSGDPSSAGTLGFVAETIASGGSGWVITEGTLRKVNTFGLPAGALLYLGAVPGTYTTTIPTSPSHSVRLGYVERVDATVGSIYVKIDNGYELGELHDVVDNTTTSSYGDLLVKSGSVWVSSRQLTGSYGLTGSLSGTSFSGSFSGSFQGNGSGLTNIPASSITGLNLSQIASGSFTASISPTSGFLVNTSASITGSLTVTASTVAATLQGSGSTVFTVNGSLGNLFQVTDTLSGSLFSVNTISGLPVIEAFSDNTVRIGQFGQRALFVSQSKVGIGKESALNGILDVSGSVTITGSTFISSSNATQLQVGSNLLFVSSSGRVGIGTTTPAYNLQILDTTSGTPQQLDIKNSTAASRAAFTLTNDANNSIYMQMAGSNYIASSLRNVAAIASSGTSVDSFWIATNWESSTGGSVPIKFVAGGYDNSPTVTITAGNPGNVGIGKTSPNARLDVNGNAIITGSLTVITGSSIELQVTNTGVKIGNASTDTHTVTGSLQVAGQTRISGSFNTAISGTILTVVGSGSTQPIFTVQGSQGELFSVTDSLSGSLFSVNDISGLPILEVFSDSTTTIGNYLAPALYTTNKITQTNSGSFVVYNLPTASYDGAFYDYTVRSGSNARAGQIMAIWSGSSVNFTETTTTSFGDTSAINFTVIVSGSNMVLTGSSATGSWTIKTIIRSI